MERKTMKFLCTAIAATFLFAGMSIAEDVKIGMMNWNTCPITNKNGELTSFTDFAGSADSPSVASGWIIQAAAGSLQDPQKQTNYSKMNSFISQVDPNSSQGHRISLNCSNDNWTHTLPPVADCVAPPPSTPQSAHCMVNNLLAYISSIDTNSITLHKNVNENGYPTLDINLDIEPRLNSAYHTTLSPLYDDWLDMIEGVRTQIDEHNSTSPSILVTLSAFIPQVMVIEQYESDYPMTPTQIAKAWAACDTLIVMAYRNLPCFDAPCVGTNPQLTSCPDGFLNSARALIDTIPQGTEGEGKHFAIALELSRDVSNCEKVSFGYNKIYDGSTGLTRQDFLKTAMQQGWDSFSSADQSKLHPDGAFMLHSYESLHCFRQDTPAPGASPLNCDIGGTCNLSSGCTPALFTPPSGVYGDVNNDGIVDANDILALEELLGSCRGDLNFDGIVNVHDILMTIGNWGACP